MTRDLARAGAWPALLTCGLAGLLAAAGCSSTSQTALPSWASALGAGVTVTAPARVAPGDGSPGAAVEGVLDAFAAKRYTAECAYLEPSAQAPCASGAAQLSSGSAPYTKNAAIGYVAIHGDEALVGTTGTFCSPDQTPQCFSNRDPAAIFSSGKPFSALWAEANKTSSQNAYMLVPCIEVGGKWYVYAPPP
jgi:hypothetical protein